MLIWGFFLSFVLLLIAEIDWLYEYFDGHGSKMLMCNFKLKGKLHYPPLRYCKTTINAKLDPKL